ncbi:N-acetylneuraminate synthase [Paenibacillus sp. WLX2291]|uniref:N-acetylneuraminate synthase n=1 Tax=Paenibacillus sp. WLX2291 TaxID=3296934 RepID=UPI0039845B13
MNNLFSDKSSSIYIIAEVGVNHNGSLEKAMQCVDVAARSGADAVKFQTFKSEKLVTKQAKKANYQSENMNSDENQFQMLKKLELSFEEFIKLKQYCDEKKIDFMSTPFDDDSAEFLDSIEVDAFKIGSGDMNNIPFLKKINQYKRPVLLSTGMSDMQEIREPLEALKDCTVILLHCTSDYPAPFEDVNLKVIPIMKQTYAKIVGYSDHTIGIEAAVAAVALGAKVIEKHFTLDRNLPGPDHKASLEPIELASLIHSIRNIEQALGDGIKRCMPSEMDTRTVARKSLVLANDKYAGEKLTEGDILVKRPGVGIEPKFYEQFIGKVLVRDMTKDMLLKWDDVK